MRGPRRGKLTGSGGCGVRVRDRTALRGDRSVPAAQDGPYRVGGGGVPAFAESGEVTLTRPGGSRMRSRVRQPAMQTGCEKRTHGIDDYLSCSFPCISSPRDMPRERSQGGGKKSRGGSWPIGSSWVLGSSRGRLATARSTLAGFAISSRLTGRPASRRPTTCMASRKTG
jgi:hypothetical protein